MGTPIDPAITWATSTVAVARVLGWKVATDSTYGMSPSAAASTNSAALAAAFVGGGTVYVPAGVFSMGAFVPLKSNLTVRGAGHGRTVLAASAATTVAVLVGTTGDAISGVEVLDLTVDGSYDTVAGAINCIQITNGSDVHVRNVEVRNVAGSGILYQGSGSGGGTPYSTVVDCYVTGTGLANGTTGFGVQIKDASHDCRVTGNTIRGVVGGMGIGLAGSGGTGYPTHCNILNNTIQMATSTTGFEAIGIATGCVNTVVAANNITDSYDNGISVTADRCAVTGNSVDGAYNHGIALGGVGSTVTGNFIRNVGKQDASAYGGVSIAGCSYCTVVGNRIVDDQGTPTMSYGIKGVSSGGHNLIGLNAISGYSIAESVSLATTDYMISGSANTDGLTVNKLHVGTLFGPDGSTALILGNTTRLSGTAYVGSSTVGPSAGSQLTVGSNLPSTRACASFVAVFGQAADIWQAATTASDNTTTTVVSGATKTGRIYSTDGFTGKELGDITGKTAAQIDALFTAVPTDGTTAAGQLSGNEVWLKRSAGKWWVSAAMTQIT